MDKAAILKKMEAVGSKIGGATWKFNELGPLVNKITDDMDEDEELALEEQIASKLVDMYEDLGDARNDISGLCLDEFGMCL